MSTAQIAFPYGFHSDTGEGRCINTEPGTFNHECNKPATNIGINKNGFRAMFCDDCKANGHEATDCVQWTKLAD